MARPSACQFTVFETALGFCAIAWRGTRVCRFQLPAADPATAAARLRGEDPAAEPAPPPASMERVIDRVRHHLAGRCRDFSTVPLDLDGLPPFTRRVYETARTIPAGQTVTYGELAERCGSPGGARAVGQAMARNPLALIIPCHRVLAAGGRLGGFSGPGGLDLKVRMLALEGVSLDD